MTAADRGDGVLLGLACGDALGEPVEGWSSDRIEAEFGELRGFVGGRVPPGGLTDDTEQALRLARSIAEQGTFDPDDIADRFVKWYEGGAVGIGGLTQRVLQRIVDGEHWREASREAWQRSREGRNAGNGSVMRAAPIAVAYADTGDKLATVSRESSRLTHWDPRCVYGCEVLNRTIGGCLHDEANPLADALAALPEESPSELVNALAAVPEDVDADELSTTGYVVDTLQTALYYGLEADSSEAAIVRAVNAGGDADTIGAVAGAVAGARFGADDLPERWLNELTARDELQTLGESLNQLDPE